MEKKIEMSKYYKFSLYLLIIILLCFVGMRLFFRIDITSNRLYSLSSASKNAAATLKEPLTINIFFSKNLPAPYNNVERYLHDLMEEYAIHGKSFFNFRFFDVSAKEGDLSEKAEENRSKAQDYGIYPVNVQRIEQDEAKVQRAYMGMVFIHGDIIERLPAVTTTDGLEYKITSTIQKMNNKISALLNLEGKMQVKLIQSSSLDTIAGEVGIEGLSELRGNLNRVVEELNAKTYGRLEFIFLNPTETPLNETDSLRYNRFGLQWPELPKPDGTTIPAGTGILALGMEAGNRSVERRLLSQGLNLTGQGLREQFTIDDMEQVKAFLESNIDNLINIHDEIGYLSGHGTLSLSPSLPPQYQMMQPQTDSLTRLNSLLGNSYTVTQVNLTDSEIPENIDTLIIAGPKENFSDWELFQIDQFLMKGKSLAIFMESFNEIQPQGQQQYSMQQPVFIPINTGLEKLMEHYGLSIKKSYVLDESCFVNRDPNSGEMPIYFAPIIKEPGINDRLNFMKNIKELIMIKNSPLVLDEERVKEQGLKSHSLLRSSSRAWEMSGQINLSPWMIRPPMNSEEMQIYNLAYLIEGEFSSYFTGKPIPDKPKPENEIEEGTDSPDNQAAKAEKPEDDPDQVSQKTQIQSEQGMLAQGRPGKIFVVGSVDILRDNILDETGASPNALFILNSIDYLNNRSDIAVMRSKNQRFNPLKETKAITRTFVKILNIAGLPALVILVGILVWVRRSSKRRLIQAMFGNKL